jgi:peptide/nickel transport system substrate-binding protein
MAVDVPGTIRALRMEPFTTPAAGPYAPIFRELSGSLRPLAHDPDSARRVLERKGWRDTDGDSIREKDGKRLRFTLLTNAGNQRRADVSQVLQRQWRAVGADVRLQQLEYGTFQARQMQKDFDALLGSWAVNLSPDISVAFETGAPFNIVSYSSARVDSLFARARAAPTAREADPLWRAAAEQIVRDQPYTWLYYYDVVVGMSERLRGVRIDTFGSYQNTWEWWIPRSRQTGAAAPPAASADTAATDTAKE